MCAAIILIYAMIQVININAIVVLSGAFFSGVLTTVGTVAVLAKLIFWIITLIEIFDQWCNMFDLIKLWC